MTHFRKALTLIGLVLAGATYSHFIAMPKPLWIAIVGYVFSMFIFAAIALIAVEWEKGTPTPPPTNLDT